MPPDDVIKFKIKIEQGRFRWSDWITLDEFNDVRPRDLMRFVSRFMSDDHGTYMKQEDAMTILAELTFDQIKDLMKEFGAQLKTWKSETLNPTLGNES